VIASPPRAGRIGTIALDAERLSPAVDALLALEMQPCVGYAVGNWRKCILLERAAGGGAHMPTAPGVSYILERLAATFALDSLDCAQVFVASRRSYVRPHRDWPASAPRYTRIHVPLQTDERGLNSEDDEVFHMGAGEIWLVDPSRPHSGGCFSDGTRVHLVLDFDPGVPLPDVFRDRAAFAPSAVRHTVEREPFGQRHLEAIYGLARIATELNFTLIADVLGTIHFEKQVGCAAMYDWLAEIAARSGNGALVRRAADLERRFLHPFEPA
jgi:L-proline cis-4-hydroxylase